MEQMEDKLGSILNNPQMMQQIMNMAQSLGAATPPPQSQKPPQQAQKPPQTPPDFDPALIQKLSAFAGQSNIDTNQRALLTALNPYLSHRKVEKLEKAMRAAKMARIASGFLGQGGLSMLTGR